MESGMMTGAMQRGHHQLDLNYFYGAIQIRHERDTGECQRQMRVT
jgi:hypothetical protein